MKIPFLVVAGTLLVPVVAESPSDLHALIQDPTIPDPAMDCLGNMDLIPSHHGDNALTWCTNTTYLSYLERCTRYSCSSAAADLLDVIHYWCAEASILLPLDQFSCASSASTAQKTELKRGTVDDLHGRVHKFYDPLVPRRLTHHNVKHGLSYGAALGLVFGVLAAVGIFILSLRAYAEAHSDRSRPNQNAILPVSEPGRGRETSTSPVQGAGANRGSTMRVRTPSPPPPYVSAPEAAHVKGRPGEPQPPSYENQPSGSSVL